MYRVGRCETTVNRETEPFELGQRARELAVLEHDRLEFDRLVGEQFPGFEFDRR